MQRRTAVIQGALAYGMRRIAAARAGETGLQIMTVPQVAARLAGGFLHPATGEIIEPAIRTALDEGGFQDLEGSRCKRRDHLLICKCDPQNCPEEINHDKRGILAVRSALWPQVRENSGQLVADSGLLRDCVAKARREPENPRLGGCAGSPQRTALRLSNP
jgi:hypothetical protein